MRRACITSAALLLSVASCWLVEEPEPCTPQFKLGDRLKVTLRKEIPPEGTGGDGGVIEGCAEAYQLREGVELQLDLNSEDDSFGCTVLVPSVSLPRYVLTSKGEEHEALSNSFDAVLDGRCGMVVRIELEADYRTAVVPSRVMPDGSSEFVLAWSSSARSGDFNTCPSSCPVRFAVDVEKIGP